MLKRLDRAWLAGGESPWLVALLCGGVGAVLFVWSVAIGLDSVTFRGDVTAWADGGRVARLRDLDPGFAKEVGFFLAPNWGLAGFVFMPAILLFLCQARVAIDDLPARLRARGMLRGRDGRSFDAAAVEADWARLKLGWLRAFPVAFAVIFVVVMVIDFWPVVGQWLVGAGVGAAEIAGTRLDHKTYEFDWSIAALYPGQETGRWANFAFSLVAYLWIALLCPSFILGAFVWLGALATFLSPRHLARIGHELVPQVSSPDRRRMGFEVFEGFFHYVVLAALWTAALALGMHLQNVFLRTPEPRHLVDMVLGTFQAAAAQDDLVEALLTLYRRLQAVGDAVDLNLRNIQCLGTGLALLLLALLLIGMVAGSIADAARHGRALLRDELRGRRGELRRLRRMTFWPLDAVALSRSAVLFYLLLIALSMKYVNFLSVILFGLVLLAVPALLWAGWTWAQARWQGDDPDDDDGTDEGGRDGAGEERRDDDPAARDRARGAGGLRRREPVPRPRPNRKRRG